MIGWKIYAGALQLVLFVVVVVILLLSAFTLLIYTQKQFNGKHQLAQQALTLANQSIYAHIDNANEVHSLDNNSHFEASTGTSSWGIFEKVSTKVTTKSTVFTKSALMGTGLTDPKKALYLRDNNKPLVLVGDAQIKGDAALPKQRVKPGQISGESYYGEQLIYGQTEDFKAFPKLSAEIEQENRLSEVASVPFIPNKPYRNSFNDPLLYLVEEGKVVLQDQHYVGHIVIRSPSRIVVRKTSHLKDVILMAPHIFIEDNTSGYFQAFATKSITVGKRCQLDYPTALVLNSKTQTIGENKVPSISVGSDSEVKGMIAYFGKGNTKIHDPQITIRDGVTIYGQVYCQDKLDLRGTVYGQVMTSYFATKHEGVVYQNHLYKGKIIGDVLSEQYAGLQFENTKKSLGKWLY